MTCLKHHTSGTRSSTHVCKGCRRSARAFLGLTNPGCHACPVRSFGFAFEPLGAAEPPCPGRSNPVASVYANPRLINIVEADRDRFARKPGCPTGGAQRALQAEEL